MEHHQLCGGGLVANFNVFIHRSDGRDDAECTGNVEDTEQHVLWGRKCNDDGGGPGQGGNLEAGGHSTMSNGEQPPC